MQAIGERVFLGLNAAVWASYGLLCLWHPATLAQLGVFDLDNWVAMVEVRAMYGGAQLAIGLFALLALLRPAQYRQASLGLFALLFTGLATSRAAALLLDGPGLALSLSGEPADYNSGALWFFEAPMALAALWLCWRGDQTSDQ